MDILCGLVEWNVIRVLHSSVYGACVKCFGNNCGRRNNMDMNDADGI